MLTKTSGSDINDNEKSLICCNTKLLYAHAECILCLFNGKMYNSEVDFIATCFAVQNRLRVASKNINGI
jgi:hypothetical protein